MCASPSISSAASLMAAPNADWTPLTCEANARRSSDALTRSASVSSSSKLARVDQVQQREPSGQRVGVVAVPAEAAEHRRRNVTSNDDAGARDDPGPPAPARVEHGGAEGRGPAPALGLLVLVVVVVVARHSVRPRPARHALRPPVQRSRSFFSGQLSFIIDVKVFGDTRTGSYLVYRISYTRLRATFARPMMLPARPRIPGRPPSARSVVS